MPCVVLNSKTGADFTCMDCGVYVCAGIHYGEPVCLECKFLRHFPADRRAEIGHRFWPYKYSFRAATPKEDKAT